MGQIYQAASGKVTPNMYTINSAMDGSQFIYGVQLGLSYKVNDWLGVCRWTYELFQWWL